MRWNAVMRESSGMSLEWSAGWSLSGRSHRSLGHLPLVRREGRQDFILLTRRDPEVIERASQLRRNLVELLGGDVEVAMGLLQPEGCFPASWLKTRRVHRRRCRPRACA